MMKNLHTVADVYQHLDSLFEQDIDSDTLFASSYLRGLFSSAVSEFADEQQALSIAIIQSVNDKLASAKTELSPQDNAIVQNFWLALQQAMLN
ncbi:MAG: YfcL family protein [Colwellia sp.]|nr:YfcL family protein [Colwellia sp.]